MRLGFTSKNNMCQKVEKHFFDKYRLDKTYQGKNNKITI